MRVVMLVGRSTGGIGTHVADLAAQLRRFGDEVEVVTDALTAERFDFGHPRLWWPSRQAGIGRSLRGLLALRRLAAGADVLHAHGHQAALVAAIALVGLRARLVVSQHNAILDARGIRGALGGLAQRLVARRADLVTGASTDLVVDAERRGARAAALAPVPSPRVPDLLTRRVLDAPARAAEATRLLREAGVPPSGPLVLTISRVAPQKDLHTLVEAAGRLDTPVTWVVIGDGDAGLLADVRARATALDAPVHFIGAVADPAPWLRAAEVFVLPSAWEARALVIQEAMAAGTPVVVSDVGGLHDLVHGVGPLVPVGDATGFAEAVGTILSDPTQRAALSAAGRGRATGWDDGESTARRWRRWYAALPSMT
jgi:glycosyltransferase involved in cell wall biosynthesis